MLQVTQRDPQSHSGTEYVTDGIQATRYLLAMKTRSHTAKTKRLVATAVEGLLLAAATSCVGERAGGKSSRA